MGLGRGLAARGHPTYIATPSRTAVRGDSSNLETWALRVGPKLGNASLSLETVRTLWRNRAVWDLLHLNQGHPQTVAGAVTARVLGRPAVVTFHLKPPPGSGIRGVFERISTRLSIALCSTRVFVSNAARTAFGAEGVVIHNGIDVDWIRDQVGERTPIREELGLDGFVVIFSGRHAKNKGFVDLLKAIRLVRDDGVDLRLLTTGEATDEERDEIESEIGRLTLGPHVLQLGDRRDHLRYLGAGDAFALPSYAEGLPMSLLEAMAAGLPVVASDVGGIPEAVTHGREGFLVRPGDVVALKVALEQLATNPGLCAAFRDQSRARAAAFDLGKTVTAYLRVYGEVLGESPLR